MRTIILAVLLLSGCAVLDAQKKCANDPACLSEVKGYAKIGEAVASPFGPMAGAGASAVIIFAGLAIRGWKKKDV